MQTALQKAAEIATKVPNGEYRGANGVANVISEVGVFVLTCLHGLASAWLVAIRINDPCIDNASAVVKKKVTASMCAGL